MRYLFLLYITALCACGDEPVPTSVVTRIARVVAIKIDVLASLPVTVNAIAKGELPDGCTQLNEVEQKRKGNVFEIRITTKRLAAVSCTQALVPFEKVVPLDLQGLPSGDYTVDINGVLASFTLQTDK